MSNCEIRIGMIGSVDAGKSTLTGVLVNNCLDDGKGAARSSVMRHLHEQETGRTSSISQNFIRYKINDEGNDLGSNEKILSLIDLCGHEKYFKTTVVGMNRLLDYCCLMVGANMGVLRMTREHLITSLSLDIPTMIVITKYDISPENKYKDTINNIVKFIERKSSGSRKPFIINNENDLIKYKKYRTDFENGLFKNIKLQSIRHIIPIFTVSSKTGYNVNLLKNYFSELNNQINYDNEKPADFIVEHCYNLKGIGTVVSGIMKDGRINTGDLLLMGSFHRKFYEVKVKSIHNNFKEFVDYLDAGQGGCFNIKIMKEKFNHKKIKSGIHVLAKPQLYSKFKAKIRILQHPTTIKVGYEPVVHCETIAQTAKIIKMDCDFLRLGDTSEVVMEFCFHPEFITIGSRMILRESGVKIVGKITEIIE